MRLICFWCAILAAAAAQAQEDGFYAPQTFRNHDDRGPVLFRPSQRLRQSQPLLTNIESYQKGLFTPAGGLAAGRDVTPQGSIVEPWRPQAQESWKAPAPAYAPAPALSQPEPWRAPFRPTKEQAAHILHHKQALTSEGNFRFEYASDNGLAAGETIEPDGSRIGAYQYKDPSGQLVKLKYRAGKEGFQILEGSHLPKSPEPIAPQSPETHYQQAYEQQRRQYELQQQYNGQRSQPQSQSQWSGQGQNQEYEGGAPAGPRPAAAGQWQWRQGQEDDGQYRENEIESANNRGPHNFGEGYEFAFQG